MMLGLLNAMVIPIFFLSSRSQRSSIAGRCANMSRSTIEAGEGKPGKIRLNEINTDREVHRVGVIAVFQSRFLWFHVPVTNFWSVS